jgi:triosephosphate isomerase
MTNTLSNNNVWIGAQNVSEYTSGAYTGEISANMLTDSCIKFCLVGHSERRHIFGETNEQTNLKIVRLLENNITPLLCIGETLDEFNDNATFDILAEQIKFAFDKLDSTQLQKIILAYEPVWAIGTGRTPTIQDIERTITFIKDYVSENYKISPAVLYGGSVNTTNSADILDIPCVDGALIGGASLDAQKFNDIANSIK